MLKTGPEVTLSVPPVIAKPPETVNIASWNVLPEGALATAKTGKARPVLLMEVEM